MTDPSPQQDHGPRPHGSMAASFLGALSRLTDPELLGPGLLPTRLAMAAAAVLRELGWTPEVPWEVGLARTLAAFALSQPAA